MPSTDQARAQLEAAEPERKRPRAEGRKYEPRPVTFSFDQESKKDDLRVLAP